MVRENSDHKVICSSIALLQERFRQLERMKEMREERELLKLISASSDNRQRSMTRATCLYEPSKLFFHSDIVFPTRPQANTSPLVSLSLWPNPSSQVKKQVNGFWDMDIETTKPSWLTDKPPLARACSVKSFEDSSIDSDVDTTLRL